jgi:hypothetical protein
VITDALGTPAAVVGMSPRAITGTLTIGDRSVSLTVAGNERVQLSGVEVVSRTSVGVVTPRA